ncbi:putative glycosyl transferase family 8 family [Talaromyces proteolyticus]|uniref:Glycosyl transferase family 8 family n=1 Tax=Talaromyces proteolyticus TaxID=1131652 RepID=A0AAD4KJC8_9EURO|nr:putative glycosyl transferase family 8 family [Talaromyces proteolyticus]KAH8693691.1 putative glycosyl transferase family 8 family [Talaromyces proteolyticus]
MYSLREPWVIRILILAPLTGLLLSLLWLTNTWYSDIPEIVSYDNDRGGASSNPKHAFATFLSGFNGTDSENYFTAVKLLTYQLVHDPRTRVRDNTPFIVPVTKDVEQERQDTLRHSGATVISVDDVQRDWIHPKWPRWNGVLAKLNLWTLTDYEKVVFVDADTVILHPMDKIFSIRATDIRDTLPTPSRVISTTANMPVTPPPKYMIAGIHDRWMEANKRPPETEPFYVLDNYMNAGFFVISPSKEMFEYYLSLLDHPDAFDVDYPEQNLLNFAHRTDGQMPWQDLGTYWNAITQLNPSYDPNVRSLHHKWWIELADKYTSDLITDAIQRMNNMG